MARPGEGGRLVDAAAPREAYSELAEIDNKDNRAAARRIPEVMALASLGCAVTRTALRYTGAPRPPTPNFTNAGEIAELDAHNSAERRQVDSG